ncbi:MAG: gluconate:H+ symporter [Spirochaetales bacterium]
MATGPLLLLYFFLAIALLLLSIIKYKINPFLALLGTAIVTGLLVMMPLKDIAGNIAAGFGNTLRGIGIVIGLGIILGQVLSEAHATDQIAHGMLEKFGERKAPTALAFSGYLISIPVFMDAAFVIMMPLARKLARITKTSALTMITALAVSTVTTHAMVIPTPGPAAVAGNMKVDFGLFILYGMIVAFPAVLVGALLYGKSLRNRFPMQTENNIALDSDENESNNDNRPSLSLSLFTLLLPILLILIGSILNFILPKGSSLGMFSAFIGDKNIALFIGVVVAILALKKYFKRSLDEIIVEAAAASGMILLITGAGGSFGTIINQSGIGKFFVETMGNLNISPIILGWVLSQILRSAQGSTTVALITTSSILGPVAAQMGASPILVGLAICAGGIGLSLPNDSGFWVVSRFGGLSVQDTFRTWTVGGTLSGLTGLLMVLILSIFSGVLPGL